MTQTKAGDGHPDLKQREYHREPCSIVVEGPDAEGIERAVLIKNISRGGMGAALFWTWEAGEEIDLKLYPDPSSDEVYQVRARVVWVRPGEPGSAGLQFLESTPEFQEWLTEVMERDSTQVEHSSEAYRLVQ
ncbi:MAG TPA: PilZ domain-containing protein [Armatimonadota bacterium]|jgi:hypothetical protein